MNGTVWTTVTLKNYFLEVRVTIKTITALKCPFWARNAPHYKHNTYKILYEWKGMDILTFKYHFLAVSVS